jgi:hypothetical protein
MMFDRKNHETILISCKLVPLVSLFFLFCCDFNENFVSGITKVVNIAGIESQTYPQSPLVFNKEKSQFYKL